MGKVNTTYALELSFVKFYWVIWLLLKLYVYAHLLIKKKMSTITNSAHKDYREKLRDSNADDDDVVY